MTYRNPPVNGAMARLSAITSNPGDYGDTIKVHALKGGGLSIEKIEDGMCIILDPDQTRQLLFIADANSEAVRRSLIERFIKQGIGKALMASYLRGALLGLVGGFLVGYLFL